MPVVELLVSAILPVLLEKLTSPEMMRFLRQEGLYSKIKTWEETLKMIQAVLGYAEEKQLEDGPVKDWLDDLQDLAYDVEDILDEFATEVSARKLKMKQHDQPSTSKVRKFVPACFGNLSPRAIKFHAHMGSEIKDVKRRLEHVTSQLEQLCKLKDGLGLEGNIAGGTLVAAHQRQPTTCVAIEPAVYGRDEDKAKILEMVLEDEPGVFNNFHVISIVGMGGIGKSTLAREVYNDKAVESFELKAWVCVSNDFDVLRISKAIFESITKSSSNSNDLNTVQIQLQDKLVGKKFLLVLDDILSNDYSLWEILRSPFKAGANGSKIIVTTRLEDVALTMGDSTRLCRLNFLSNDDCWSLFQAHAFGDEVNPTHDDMESIRQKVIEKSKGLPLASRILGGLLRAKQIDEWLEILNSKMWDFEDKSEIPATLKLSYFYLPSHLKRCFAHCAILLEDYEFQEEELVLLWLAEGLIQPSKENKQWEDLGHDYFHDLLSRSLFQLSNTNESKYIMHDLVRDLARWASGGTCFHLEDMLGANKPLGSFKKVRHLSYAWNYLDGAHKFEVISQVEWVDQRLRTFLPFLRNQVSMPRYISQTVIFDLLPKLKNLRMLSLEDYNIIELPESFGDLRCLRFLNLSGTRIKRLPESTSSLINLLILKLKGCSCLKKLPSKIRNLIKLRYLDIRGVHLDEMPVGMNELKCLRYLSDFVVGKNVESGLKDLKNLESLYGELCISGLENVVDSLETSEMILNDKQKLKMLELKWNFKFDCTRDEVKEKKVLDMLRPHKNLQMLKIKFYGGAKFSSWLGDSSFSKMTVLELESCRSCTLLPPLGVLKSLKDLTITRMKGMKSIGNEFSGQHCSTPFPSLKTLCFKDLQEWNHWEPIKENEYGGAFPCLQDFSITNCPKLSGSLPCCLPSLEKIVIENCKQLVVSLSSLPLLSDLDINGCKGITCNSPIDFKSLKSMTITNITEFGNWSRQDYFQKAELLCISGMSSEQLTNFWQMNGTFLERPTQGVQSFKFITDLQVISCSDVVSFPEVCYFSNLCKLEISKCNALTSLPVEMNHKNANLESLTMSSCSSLRFIVNGQLPPSLKTLEIKCCDKLEYLWDDREVSCASVVNKEKSRNTSTSLLEYLSVYNCPSLTSLSLSGRLPVTLSILYICEIQELESIAENFHDNRSLEKIIIQFCEKLKTIPKGLHNLSRLCKIYIENCRSIVNLAEEGLPNKLSELEIGYCEKLEELPKGFHSLDSLKSLTLYKCLSMRSFPEKGFPRNLTSLTINGEVNIYKPLLEWGLHNLTSLKSLYIQGRRESFPQQELEMTLPLSLNNLVINEFPNLKLLLSHGFRNLNSLEWLEINDCPNLTSFPKLALPSSLQSLWITECPNIKSISELGLPPSLLQFHISNCPKLKEECKRDKGKAWPKISSIPCVEIDYTSIYDLEEEK